MIQQFLAMIDKKIETKDSIFGQRALVEGLQELHSEVEKMEDNIVSKKDALSFAYWYHNGLRNGERRSVEEEFEKYMNETI